MKRASEEIGTAAVSRHIDADSKSTLLRNVLLPTSEGYARNDVLLAEGKISKILPTNTAAFDASTTTELDCTQRLLLPGFVNAHTHSIEHWARGLIKPLPLELWVVASFAAA